MPTHINRPATQSLPGFSGRADELRSELRHIPADLLAARTGCFYIELGTGSGEFHLEFFDTSVTGTYPDLKYYSTLGDELSEFQQMLILYYFATADGTALTGKFVSFADLPGGRIYAQAFQGYSGNEVVKIFGENLDAFKEACLQANGQPVALADAAYVFQVLPQVSAQFVYWLGDEEFPSSCKILFDAAATHNLPIDACAIIGSTLTRRIIKNYHTKMA